MFVLIIRGRNVAYGPFRSEQAADDWLVEKNPDDLNEQPLILEVQSPGKEWEAEHAPHLMSLLRGECCKENCLNEGSQRCHAGHVGD